MATINIRDGRVVDPAQDLDAVMPLHIADGRIRKMQKPLPAADVELDAAGLVVAPGFLDIHVHLRTPGQTDKEDLRTGLQAAVAGGFTAVACMPNTTPPLCTRDVIEPLLETARNLQLARLYPIAAISRDLKGATLSDIIREGHPDVPGYSDDGFPVTDPVLLRQAFRLALSQGKAVFSHCEDPLLAKNGVLHTSAARRFGLPSLSGESESRGVAHDIAVARETGGRLHVLHVSTRQSVDLLRRAKAQGIRVTGEAAPHHFVLSADDIREQNANFKMNPPLRDPEDREAVITGLMDGTLDAIASDHAPHTIAEKALGLREAPFGILGMEVAVPLAVTYLVKARRMSLSALVRLFSTQPANILGLAPNCIRVGNAADLTIFDPNQSRIVDGSRFFSKARNCPFLGWTLQGRVIATLVEGRLVYQANRVP